MVQAVDRIVNRVRGGNGGTSSALDHSIASPSSTVDMVGLGWGQGGCIRNEILTTKRHPRISSFLDIFYVLLRTVFFLFFTDRAGFHGMIHAHKISRIPLIIGSF